MRKSKLAAALLLACALLLAAAPALAADVFVFREKSVTVFEGETWQAEIRREGAPAETEGIVYTSGNTRVLTVDDSGLVTGLRKGQAQVTATLKTARKTWKTTTTVTVARRVTKVTLSRKNLTVYDPSDPEVFDLLQGDPADPVILLPAGSGVNLSAVCTPEDASSRRVTFTTTDVGVAKVQDRVLRGIQAGECELIVASEQNPEITESFHVLVTQPVAKLEITGGNTVGVGGTLPLSVLVTPANATVKQVEWSSRAPGVATVDGNGVVTGVKRGRATIDVKAKDGSGRTASLYLTVTQPPTAVTLKETYVRVSVGRRVTLAAQILPADANDRNVTWSSSDESVATVQRGQVTGVKAGTCEIICASAADPSVRAAATVQVIQPVTRVEIGTANGISIPAGSSETLVWSVFPADASIRDVTFSSNHTKIATVDAGGVIRGISRGSATITVTAADGSGRKASIRVNVTQPVEGVSIQYGVYHIQTERSLSVKALISPKDANNYNMSWYTDDPSVATVSGRKNVGSVRGHRRGVTTVTGVTEDGGYSASAEIRVGDFNGAAMLEEVRVRDNRDVRLVLRNMSDFTIEKVFFRVECFDMDNNPMVCSEDGESTFFEGDYPLTLEPGERSVHGYFNFYRMAIGQPVGAIIVRITGWLDSEGYRRYINDEEDQPTSYWFDAGSPGSIHGSGSETVVK